MRRSAKTAIAAAGVILVLIVPASPLINRDDNGAGADQHRWERARTLLARLTASGEQSMGLFERLIRFFEVATNTGLEI